MRTSRRRGGVLPVVFDTALWEQEVQHRYGDQRPGALAREARRGIERQGGLRVDEVRRCEVVGRDGTLLGGCVKVYLPLGGRAPSEQPWAFVLRGHRAVGGAVTLTFVSFGLRHPPRGDESVYVRAHTRLHGAPPGRGR